MRGSEINLGGYGACLLILLDRNIDPDLLVLGECSEVSVLEAVAIDVVYQTTCQCVADCWTYFVEFFPAYKK